MNPPSSLRSWLQQCFHSFSDFSSVVRYFLTCAHTWVFLVGMFWHCWLLFHVKKFQKKNERLFGAADATHQPAAVKVFGEGAGQFCHNKGTGVSVSPFTRDVRLKTFACQTKILSPKRFTPTGAITRTMAAGLVLQSLCYQPLFCLHLSRLHHKTLQACFPCRKHWSRTVAIPAGFHFLQHAQEF